MTGRWTTGLTLALVLGAPLASPARACDVPGNPVNLQTMILGADSIRLSWANAEGKGGGRFNLWFDISIHDQNDKPANGADGKPLDIIGGAHMAQIKYMDRTSYDIKGLKPDTVYRIKMRSRTEAFTGGCVSEKFSEQVTVRTISDTLNQICNDYANKAYE